MHTELTTTIGTLDFTFANKFRKEFIDNHKFSNEELAIFLETGRLWWGVFQIFVKNDVTLPSFNPKFFQVIQISPDRRNILIKRVDLENIRVVNGPHPKLNESSDNPETIDSFKGLQPVIGDWYHFCCSRDVTRKIYAAYAFLKSLECVEIVLICTNILQFPPETMALLAF